MQRAKAFFFVCAGVCLLALAYHLGARSAHAQTAGPGWFFAGAAAGSTYLTTTTGDVWAFTPGLNWRLLGNIFGAASRTIVSMVPGELLTSTGEVWYSNGNPTETFTNAYVPPIPTTAVSGAAPASGTVALRQPHPNPAHSTSAIDFDLPQSGRVNLTIYSAQGQVVRVLVDEVRPAGRHSLVWDGTDNQGQAAPSGTYFCVIKAPGGMESRKTVLVR